MMVNEKSKEAGTMSGLRNALGDCDESQEHPLVDPQALHLGVALPPRILLGRSTDV